MKKDEQSYFDSSIPHDRLVMRKKAREAFGKLVQSIDVQRSSSQQTAYAQEVERRLNQLEIFAKCVDKFEREVAKKMLALHNLSPQVLELMAGQPRFLDKGFANNDLELHASMFSAAYNQQHKITQC